MKIKYNQLLGILVLLLVFWQIGGCTRATKDNGEKSQIKLQLPEKIKVVNGKVQATSVGGTLTHVAVTVTGSEMQEVSAEQSCTTQECIISNSIALEVPMGEKRVFQIVAAYNSSISPLVNSISSTSIIYGAIVRDIKETKMDLDIQAEAFGMQSDTTSEVGDKTLAFAFNNLVNNPAGITAIDIFTLKQDFVSEWSYRDYFNATPAGFRCQDLAFEGFTQTTATVPATLSVNIAFAELSNTLVILCPRAGDKYISRLGASVFHYESPVIEPVTPPEIDPGTDNGPIPVADFTTPTTPAINEKVLYVDGPGMLVKGLCYEFNVRREYYKNTPIIVEDELPVYFYSNDTLSALHFYSDSTCSAANEVTATNPLRIPLNEASASIYIKSDNVLAAAKYVAMAEYHVRSVGKLDSIDTALTTPYQLKVEVPTSVSSKVLMEYCQPVIISVANSLNVTVPANENVPLKINFTSGMPSFYTSPACDSGSQIFYSAGGYASSIQVGKSYTVIYAKYSGMTYTNVKITAAVDGGVPNLMAGESNYFDTVNFILENPGTLKIQKMSGGILQDLDGSEVYSGSCIEFYLTYYDGSNELSPLPSGANLNVNLNDNTNPIYGDNLCNNYVGSNFSFTEGLSAKPFYISTSMGGGALRYSKCFQSLWNWYWQWIGKLSISCPPGGIYLAG